MGSSPLTRGKPTVLGSVRRSSGLIPAHAGKTISEHANSDPAQAHPRSRGENDPLGLTLLLVPGSSPLTRGKRRTGRTDGARPWLIPAHAGKTSSGVCRAYPAWAHPRSRGENATMGSRARRNPGSSPLTRGKLSFVRSNTIHPRLIPAHAGKTNTAGRARMSPRAHPRSRGENHIMCLAMQDVIGSSPLTRGKR